MHNNGVKGELSILHYTSNSQIYRKQIGFSAKRAEQVGKTIPWLVVLTTNSKIGFRSENQLRLCIGLFEFEHLLEGELDSENRWVILSIIFVTSLLE